MIESEKVLKALEDVFEDIDTTKFDLDTEFKNNDEWDSMTALSLITVLDQEFDISISGEKIKEINTVRELVNLLNE